MDNILNHGDDKREDDVDSHDREGSLNKKDIFEKVYRNINRKVSEIIYEELRNINCVENNEITNEKSYRKGKGLINIDKYNKEGEIHDMNKSIFNEHDNRLIEYRCYRNSIELEKEVNKYHKKINELNEEIIHMKNMQENLNINMISINKNINKIYEIIKSTNYVKSEKENILNVCVDSTNNMDKIKDDLNNIHGMKLDKLGNEIINIKKYMNNSINKLNDNLLIMCDELKIYGDKSIKSGNESLKKILSQDICNKLEEYKKQKDIPTNHSNNNNNNYNILNHNKEVMDIINKNHHNALKKIMPSLISSEIQIQFSKSVVPGMREAYNTGFQSIKESFNSLISDNKNWLAKELFTLEKSIYEKCEQYNNDMLLALNNKIELLQNDLKLVIYNINEKMNTIWEEMNKVPKELNDCNSYQHKSIMDEKEIMDNEININSVNNINNINNINNLNNLNSVNSVNNNNNNNQMMIVEYNEQDPYQEHMHSSSTNSNYQINKNNVVKSKVALTNMKRVKEPYAHSNTFVNSKVNHMNMNHAATNVNEKGVIFKGVKSLGVIPKGVVSSNKGVRVMNMNNEIINNNMNGGNVNSIFNNPMNGGNVNNIFNNPMNGRVSTNINTYNHSNTTNAHINNHSNNVNPHNTNDPSADIIIKGKINHLLSEQEYDQAFTLALSVDIEKNTNAFWILQLCYRYHSNLLSEDRLPISQPVLLGICKILCESLLRSSDLTIETADFRIKWIRECLEQLDIHHPDFLKTNASVFIQNMFNNISNFLYDIENCIRKMNENNDNIRSKNKLMLHTDIVNNESNILAFNELDNQNKKYSKYINITNYHPYNKNMLLILQDKLVQISKLLKR
ncbi:hypothetical protein PFMALIP_01329 [Plasmodium falciparum MaliPS096_E11]|uniref:Uncharacterized protein n=1 Tax=Plasmodium falciparum MaliPS096_E11 TaxID=1036727 RepID=A0A024WVT5_PLAFA|nr:hypothetical protein PFMALIP_01329 [Plasmodium falciparum MaliPS096_E11]